MQWRNKNLWGQRLASWGILLCAGLSDISSGACWVMLHYTQPKEDETVCFAAPLQLLPSRRPSSLACGCLYRLCQLSQQEKRWWALLVATLPGRNFLRLKMSAGVLVTVDVTWCLGQKKRSRSAALIITICKCSNNLPVTCTEYFES